MDANGTWYGLMDQKALAKKKPPSFRVIIIGAGERGRCYAKALQHTNGIVSAVADPVAVKRRLIGNRFIWKDDKPKPEHEFETWRDFLNYEKLRRQRETAGEIVEPGVDAAFICVQDSGHAEAIVGLAPLGLHLFCEKPLATSLDDCLDIYASLLKDGPGAPLNHVFGIGHVLRYSPHNKQLRKMVLEERCIGDIVSIEHTEPVGYWHFAHSYVRGNWRKESTSAPSLLAKSCHDIDFLLWLLCSPVNTKSGKSPHLPSSISSTGHLGFFTKARKPTAAGDATNCLSCPIEDKCIFSSKKIYTEQELNPQTAHNWPWPVSVLNPNIEEIYTRSGLEMARQTVLEELSRDYKKHETPVKDIEANNWFGRCVWEADNDVCDDQIVLMAWDTDITQGEPHRSAKTASLHMIAQTKDQCIRRGRIYGSEGEISYDSSNITTHNFRTGRTETIKIALRGGGHGDGDQGLTEQFAAAVEACKNGSMSAEDAQKAHIGCTLEEIIRSHAVVFAAESARQERMVIDWSTWWKREVETKLMERTGWDLVQGVSPA